MCWILLGMGRDWTYEEYMVLVGIKYILSYMRDIDILVVRIYIA